MSVVQTNVLEIAYETGGPRPTRRWNGSRSSPADLREVQHCTRGGLRDPAWASHLRARPIGTGQCTHYRSEQRPRDNRGRAVFSTDFTVLRPVHPTADSTLLYSVSNRGESVADGLDYALAIVESAAALPDIDPRRIVVVGQSAGGFGAIALADAPPPGVLGVISFTGGRSGDDHENICGGAARLIEATATLGRANRVPQLWLVAANDHFIPPALAHAYQAGSAPTIKFVDLPPFGDDGHKTFALEDASVWDSAVGAFLAEVTATPKSRP